MARINNSFNQEQYEKWAKTIAKEHANWFNISINLETEEAEIDSSARDLLQKAFLAGYQAEQSRIIKIIDEHIKELNGILTNKRFATARIAELDELLSSIKPDEALERIASKPDLEIRELTSEEDKELQRKLSKEKIMVEREKCICEKDCECNCSYCNCLKNKRHFEGTISLGQCCTDTKKDVHNYI